MSTFEMAKNYYDRGLWDEHRIRTLGTLGKLTEEEVGQILGTGE